MAITSEQMRVFRRGAREREETRVHEIENRRSQAWPIAKEAARLLKEEFGSSQVLVFGSLAHGHWFHAQSDIDLAVWHMLESEFWRAWARVDGLSTEFAINLVNGEMLPPDVYAEIIGYGVVI